MALRRRDMLKTLAASLAGAALPWRSASAHPGDELERDVAILGGGSAGTYAALRLRDLGYSVVILERSQRLGGHAETYYDPTTGAPIDIGVVVFPDQPLVRNYFARFGVSLVTSPGGGGASSQFVDFRTGLAVDAYRPSGAEVGAALGSYLQLLTTRFAFLAQPGFQLPQSGPVLDDLLSPFGTFVQRYGLTALLPTFFLFEQGFGSLLGATTLYVLKNMSAAVVGSVLGAGFLAVPTGTSSLYRAATAELAGDVLFGAQSVQVDRRARKRLRLRVQTQAGNHQVRVRKLLVTAPPTLRNLNGFDLDNTEARTLGRFTPEHYWTAVAKIEGNLSNVSLVNTAPGTPFNLAPLPGIYSVGPTPVPGLFNVKYGSSRELGDERVKRSIEDDIERVRVPAVGPLGFEGFAIFKNHSPYCLHASPADIRAGFYRDLAALQGRNDTFYAGAAFETHSSAAIWAYLEQLLPTMFG